MIDYDGFRQYLSRLGFAEQGINTYLSYISANKIAILSQIEEYQNLSDEEKIWKFSNEPTSFRRIFDEHHNYANDTTFNNLRSGARRYKYYLQYLSLLKTMEKYDADITVFDLNHAYVFYKVFNEKLYPVKVMCRENLKILELDESFTTNQAKDKLKQIFDQQNAKNIHFEDTRIQVEIMSLVTLPKNIILYGPPGVGKTYSHKKLISILENGDSLNELTNQDYKLEAFNEVKSEGRYQFLTFHQSYSYEDFVEGFRPNEEGKIVRADGIIKELSKKAKANSEKNYYLILDEINRGNISKIFGELITLLEEDKRLGEDNELMVTLPYSKEQFGVPKNLYIIGTMNTADKSIALVDIALRRRFTFVRMNPITEKLPSSIQQINDKIIEKKGKSAEDYLIGHAYFIDKDGSKIDEGHPKYLFVMKYKIRPLLEEYFYGENIDEIFEGLVAV